MTGKLHELKKKMNIAEEFFETVSDVVFIKDANGVYQWCNDAFLKVLGVKIGEVVGKTDYDLFVKETADIFSSNDKKVFIDNKSIRVEEEVACFNGEKLIFELLRIPLVSQECYEKALLCIGKNITKLRRNEEDLILKNEQLRKVINLVPAYIIAKDIDGKFLIINEYAANLLTLNGNESPQDIEGKHDYEYISDKKLVEQWSRENIDIITNGREVHGQTYIPINDGSTKYFKTIRVPYTHPGHDKPAVLGIAINIDKQKAIELDLRESQKRFEDAAKVTGECLLELDAEKRVIYVSDKIKDIFGLEKEEIMGKAFSNFIHEEDLDYFEQKLDVNYIENAEIKDLQIRILNKASKIKWVSLNLLINKEAKTNAIILRGALNDITHKNAIKEELISAKEKAEAANISKSQFLATMSHEIRTPMNGILGFLQLLEMSDTNDEQKDFITSIKESTYLLLNIMNDILDISKVEVGKIEIEKIVFDLRNNLEKVIEPFVLTGEQNGIDVCVEIEPNVPKFVIGDAIRLKQIINNLLSNALKFTHEGSVDIIVKLENSDNDKCEVLFMITDTGIGIKEEDIDIIFKPFEQVDNSSTRDYGGTGLGLFICKSIVELMGGSIKVNSKEGEGTSFEIRIGFDMTQVLQKREYDYSVLQGKKVLVVAEDKNIRNSAKLHLEEMGCIIDEAKDALKAIGKLVNVNGCNYNVVLIECNLSGMSVNEFIATLKAISSTKNVPLILITKSITEEEILKKKDNEFDTTLCNINQRIEFLNCVASVLENKKEDFEINNLSKVLIVEDDKRSEEYIGKILSSKGINYDIATNGQEAIDAYKATEYDLIFMDCQMPVMDGYNATRKIREIEQQNNAHVPIVALTAFAMKGDKEKCIEAGMDDYLSKPVAVEEIDKVLVKYS